MTIDEKAVLLLNYIRGLGKVLEDEWQSNAQNIGLTLAEQHIIWIVYTRKKISVTDVATIGLWDRSTVMQVIKRLQDKDLVELVKDDRDLRVTYIILTEEGERKRVESSKKDFKLFDFLDYYEKKHPEGMSEILKFHREANQYFHGTEFIDWVEETKDNLDK